MKKPQVFIFVFLAGACAGLLFTGCAATHVKELSAVDFVKQAGEINEVNGAHWTRYVGRTQGRVYLEYQHSSLIGDGVRTTVYWTNLPELPKEIAENIKVGNAPWGAGFPLLENSESQ